MTKGCWRQRKVTQKPRGIAGWAAITVVAVVISIAFILLAAGAWGQRRPHYPVPPSPAQSEPPQPAPQVHAKPNPAELERKGHELANLASTIPADIQQVNKGVLPKDIVGKLKRIEKLSKQLRAEIGP